MLPCFVHLLELKQPGLFHNFELHFPLIIGPGDLQLINLVWHQIWHMNSNRSRAADLSLVQEQILRVLQLDSFPKLGEEPNSQFQRRYDYQFHQYTHLNLFEVAGCTIIIQFFQFQFSYSVIDTFISLEMYPKYPQQYKCQYISFRT